jgi:hypothetical protein
MLLAAGTAALAAGAAQPSQTSKPPAVPVAVTTVLAQARTFLKGSRDIGDVASLDVIGTETLLRDGHSKVDPYEFKVLLPDSLQLRTGPVIHTLARGAYGRRLVDTARYGGPLVDRMMADPESQKAGARGMPFHLMRICLTYLLRTPSTMHVVARDDGIRDFGKVKGRALVFGNADQHLTIEVVLDPVSARPLATVSHVRTTNGERAGDTTWISIPEDYRDVSGVRLPHRIDEWIGANHSRLDLSNVAVNRVKPADFVTGTPGR